MRKIEQQMCAALLKGKPMSKDNTVVTIMHDQHGDYHSGFVYLHGHEIAHYYYSGTEEQWVMRLTDARWRTTTTKSRLNALLEGVGQGDRLRIYQRCNGCKTEQFHHHKWFYTMGANDYRWDGESLFMANDPTTKRSQIVNSK